MDNYITTMVFRAEIVVFGGFDLMLMDIRTYGHTDGPSHRDARTHLKSRIMISVRFIWNYVAAVNQTEENTASAEKYFLCHSTLCCAAMEIDTGCLLSKWKLCLKIRDKWK